MDTPIEVKDKYFDLLYKTLIEMTVQADEDCPQGVRTEEFRLAMEKSYYLIQSVGIEVFNSEPTNEEPPSIEL